jgi:predicted nucleotidyltransferase
MKLIQQNIKPINALCQKHNVKELYAFGSVTRNDFTKKSDVDLLVEFKRMPVLDYADNYFDLILGLEKIFKRKVDLLTQKSLRNPVLISILNATKQKVYEA